MAPDDIPLMDLIEKMREAPRPPLLGGEGKAEVLAHALCEIDRAAFRAGLAMRERRRRARKRGDDGAQS